MYLDNGATTMVAEETAGAMASFFASAYGNPSSMHGFGTEAKKVLEDARNKIAGAINAEADEIIFTSGGTEANNTALKSACRKLKCRGKNHIITSKIEHPSILNTCRALESEGFEISYVDVDREGIVDVSQLKSLIKENTGIVSVMHANNEIGTIQPIREIGKICRDRGVLFHTDAVQSFMKVPLDVVKDNIDMASFSAHKLHGPKGVGALFAKKVIELENILHGGHQEHGRRAGTENMPGIIGFGKAVEVFGMGNMAELRDYMADRILKEIPYTHLNGCRDKRLANNINISFDYIEGEALLMKLNDRGIAVSTGSACSSKNLEPSHVLMALGLKPVQAHGAIRFTLSRHTTKEEIDYVIENLKEAVEELRKLSPLR